MQNNNRGTGWWKWLVLLILLLGFSASWFNDDKLTPIEQRFVGNWRMATSDEAMQGRVLQFRADRSAISIDRDEDSQKIVQKNKITWRVDGSNLIIEEQNSRSAADEIPIVVVKEDEFVLGKPNQPLIYHRVKPEDADSERLETDPPLTDK